MTLVDFPYISRSPKIRVVMKEIKQLLTSLPVNAGASIFVRQVTGTFTGFLIWNVPEKYVLYLFYFCDQVI